MNDPQTERRDVKHIQPEGLTDSSRWSFGGKGGTTTGKGPFAVLHPGGAPGTDLAQCEGNRSGTPAGVRRTCAPYPGGRAPFPPRPPATICQPFGLEKAEACFAGSRDSVSKLLNIGDGFLGE